MWRLCRRVSGLHLLPKEETLTGQAFQKTHRALCLLPSLRRMGIIYDSGAATGDQYVRLCPGLCGVKPEKLKALRCVVMVVVVVMMMMGLIRPRSVHTTWTDGLEPPTPPTVRDIVCDSVLLCVRGLMS